MGAYKSDDLAALNDSDLGAAVWRALGWVSGIDNDLYWHCDYQASIAARVSPTTDWKHFGWLHEEMERLGFVHETECVGDEDADAAEVQHSWSNHPDHGFDMPVRQTPKKPWLRTATEAALLALRPSP